MEPRRSIFTRNALIGPHLISGLLFLGIGALMGCSEGIGVSGAAVADSLAGFVLGDPYPEVHAQLPETADCYRTVDGPASCTVYRRGSPDFPEVDLLFERDTLESIAGTYSTAWEQVSMDTMVARLSSTYGAPPDTVSRHEQPQFVWEDSSGKRFVVLVCVPDLSSRWCMQMLRRGTWEAQVAFEDSLARVTDDAYRAARLGRQVHVTPQDLGGLDRDSLQGATVVLERARIEGHVGGKEYPNQYWLVTNWDGTGGDVFTHCVGVRRFLREGEVVRVEGMLRTVEAAREAMPRIEVADDATWLDPDTCEVKDPL